MKRIFSLLLAVLLLLTCGCAAGTEDDLTDILSEVLVDSQAATPTPAPTPEPYTYSFDRYLLPIGYQEYLNEHASCAELWPQLMDAVYRRDASFALSDFSCADILIDVFSVSPYAAFAELTKGDGHIDIHYTDAVSVETLEASVKTLMEAAITPQMNETEKALHLYKLVSSTFVYEESESNSLYRALTEKKGDAEAFAAALQYLFTCADIPAHLATGSAAEMTHWWVTAELNGVLYHFDPVFESGATAGLGLTYFGMSDPAHQAAGCDAEYTLDLQSAPTRDLCENDCLDGAFRDVISWDLDTDAHELTLHYNASGAAVTVKTEE